jgi:hypothetical protein
LAATGVAFLTGAARLAVAALTTVVGGVVVAATMLEALVFSVGAIVLKVKISKRYIQFISFHF